MSRGWKSKAKPKPHTVFRDPSITTGRKDEAGDEAAEREQGEPLNSHLQPADPYSAAPASAAHARVGLNDSRQLSLLHHHHAQNQEDGSQRAALPLDSLSCCSGLINSQNTYIHTLKNPHKRDTSGRLIKAGADALGVPPSAHLAAAANTSRGISGAITDPVGEGRRR